MGGSTCAIPARFPLPVALRFVKRNGHKERWDGQVDSKSPDPQRRQMAEPETGTGMSSDFGTPLRRDQDAGWGDHRHQSPAASRTFGSVTLSPRC